MGGCDEATPFTEEIGFRRACAITSVASSWQGARQEGFLARSDLVQGRQVSHVRRYAQAMAWAPAFSHRLNIGQKETRAPHREAYLAKFSTFATPGPFPPHPPLSCATAWAQRASRFPYGGEGTKVAGCRNTRPMF